MSVRVSGLTECKASVSTRGPKRCGKLPDRPVSPTSDAAVADPHQVVSGSLVAWHQVVDLGVDSHFFAPCNQRTAKKGAPKATAHASTPPRGGNLTDEQTGVHAGIFRQQLFTDVDGWIILILDTQQDLVLQQREIPVTSRRPQRSHDGAERRSVLRQRSVTLG